MASEIRKRYRNLLTIGLFLLVWGGKLTVRRWNSTVTSAPDQPVVVVARDQSETGWLAFSGPVEVGRLSLWCRVLAAWG